MRIFASVRISHHISDSLWLCLLFPRCNTVKDFGNSEKRSSLLYLMMFLIYSLYLCLCACEYGSVFLMLDEEYNLLKKNHWQFQKAKTDFFFLFFKNTVYFKEQADGQKKAFGSKYLPFHLIVLNDSMCFSPHGLLENLENSRHLIQGPAKKQLWKALVYKLGMRARMVLKSADDSQQGCNFFLFFLRRVEEVYEK